MEGPLIFFACMVAATLGILLTLYAVARDAKPNHQHAPFSLYRQRDGNGGLPRSDNTSG
jgi:hypothetical protein